MQHSRLNMPDYPVILVPVQDNDGMPFYLPDLLTTCGLEALALDWEAVVKGYPLTGQGVWYDDGVTYRDHLLLARVELPLDNAVGCASVLAGEASQVCVGVWYPPGTDAPEGSLPLVAVDCPNFDTDPGVRDMAHTRLSHHVLVSAVAWGVGSETQPAGALAFIYPAPV